MLTSFFYCLVYVLWLTGSSITDCVFPVQMARRTYQDKCSIQWKESWSQERDCHGVKIELWCARYSDTQARCKWCGVTFRPECDKCYLNGKQFILIFLLKFTTYHFLFVEKWRKKIYIYMYKYLFNVVTNFNKRSDILLF